MENDGRKKIEHDACDGQVYDEKMKKDISPTPNINIVLCLAPFSSVLRYFSRVCDPSLSVVCNNHDLKYTL